MYRRLFLCRTPLQARLFLEIADEGFYPLDIVYVTMEDSPVDRAYFARLEQRADRTLYLRWDVRLTDARNNLAMIARWARWNGLRRYEEIYLGSIGSLFFRFILARMPKARILTLDDGSANITKGSGYFQKTTRKRRFEKLLRVPHQDVSTARIAYHYTLFKGLDNIVPPGKLIHRPIDWGEGERTEPGLTYFIGQPASEYLMTAEIARMRTWLKGQDIDYYVQHPRELEPMTDRFPILPRDSQLAEEAIFASSPGRPTIIAPYSTVLFTIPATAARKIYLSVVQWDEESERIRLVEKVGCEVMRL